MAAYSRHMPKPYQQHQSLLWWLGRWTYLKFMLREFSCIFMAYFVVLTLMQIRALRHGPQAYAAFQEHLRNPVVILLNALSLGFVVFHGITFFNAMSTATVVRVGGKRVPDTFITLPNYAAWAVVTVVVAWIVLRA